MRSAVTHSFPAIGTLNLVKSGATFISALILTFGLKREISSLQWLAIGIQTLALVLSQYDSCKGSTIYAFNAYIVMSLALSITCVTGVWNEHILKNSRLPVCPCLGAWFVFHSAQYATLRDS